MSNCLTVLILERASSSIIVYKSDSVKQASWKSLIFFWQDADEFE